MLKNSKSLITKNTVVYILAIICCILWGSAFPCIKIGYSMLGITSNDTASQILFAGLRFTLTGMLTILIFSIINKSFLIPRKKSWVNIGKLGFVQTIVQYLFFYIGLSNTTAAKSSIIGGISPFAAILIACFIFKQEKFTKSKLLGSLIGFAGIIMINIDFINLKTSMTLTGEGFILISGVASALSSSMIKDYSKQENPVVLSGYQFLLGGVIMTAVGFIMGGKLNFINKDAILILLYLALLSAIAYSLWSILLKYNSVSKVTIFGFMIPVFGVILSAILLKESKQALNLQSLISLLMVCFGIIIINKYNRKAAG
jgi:drug/metabolite transporter (DMT)-like permease